MFQDIIPAGLEDLDLEGGLSLEMEVEGVDSERAGTEEEAPPTTMELDEIQNP